MGWFGSLQLAYKYAIVLGSLFFIVIVAGVIKVYFSKRRLKKYERKAEEDASSAGEERVELNKRELDEGDLFGVRAIQSGYFGGVAQSRPSSIAEDRSDRDSMASNTLLGSHQSPERKGPSPMSSVVTLPLEARTASPLRHTVISASDPDRPWTPQRQGQQPVRSTLQPSDAQANGKVTHDPAVNMFLNVPPSPGATSRPSSYGFDSRSRSSSGGSIGREETPERSPESPSFPQNSHYSGHYIPTAAPQIPVTGENRSSARPSSSTQYPDYEPQSQSASIISRESDATIRDNNRSLRSSIQEEHDFSTRPVKSRTNFMRRNRSSIQEEDEFTVRPSSRPFSTYRPYPSRTSSYGNPLSGPLESSPPRNEVPAVHPLDHRASSGGDLSAEIPSNIHSPATNYENSGRYHTSHLSDASSVYSSAQRQSILPENFTSIRNQSQSFPTDTLSEATTPAHPVATSENGLRNSGESSHQIPTSYPGSTSNSHRNTRELGDFYDSYWRQSGQSVNIREWENREGRRDRLGIEVPTITEVETPLASPAPGGGVGRAM